MKVPGTVPDFQELDMSEHEIAVYEDIDGELTVRGLIRKSELTEFEVERILFQLLTAGRRQRVELRLPSRITLLPFPAYPSCCSNQCSAGYNDPCCT